MYKKLYHTNEYNAMLRRIVSLKSDLKVIRKVAEEDHNIELKKVDEDHFNHIVFDMMQCDSPSDSTIKPWYDNSLINISGWYRKVNSVYEREMTRHYRSVNVSTMAHIVSSCPALADQLTSKSLDPDKLIAGLASVDIDRGTAMCYYDEEAVANYEIITRYLFTTLLLKHCRSMVTSIHRLCHEVGKREYVGNRSIQSIRAKTEEAAHNILPGNGARYADDFHPLVEGGKRGWGYTGKVVVLPDGFTPKPAGMLYHNADAKGYNASIPFMTSKRQLEKLKSVFDTTLVTNVVSSKRGLVTYIHGQVESKEAADEDVELYEVTTDYYRNSNNMKHFISDACFTTADFDEDNNSSVDNTVKSRLKGIRGIGRSTRSSSTLYSISNCGPTQLTRSCQNGKATNFLSVVQQGASVVPGINLKVEVEGNNYARHVETYNNISTYRIGWHDSLEITSQRVDSEWDIDTDKPCVMQFSSTLFKDRLPPRSHPTFHHDKGVAMQEKRYVAKWLSDTGYTELVSGTSPKRALANIRRRIRNSIVDSLDIF